MMMSGARLSSEGSSLASSFSGDIELLDSRSPIREEKKNTENHYSRTQKEISTNNALEEIETFDEDVFDCLFKGFSNKSE